MGSVWNLDVAQEHDDGYWEETRFLLITVVMFLSDA